MPLFKTILSFSVLLFATGVLAAAQTETPLYSFTDGNDGAQPFAGLVLDGSGNVYGTASYGGQTNLGVAFELSPGTGGWSESVIHTFTGGSGDGSGPGAALIMDSRGNLYGTTGRGGTGTAPECGGEGCGTVFKLTKSKSKWEEKVTYSFPGGQGGNAPENIVFDNKENIYGTTYSGGTKNLGTVFELSQAAPGMWTRKTLHRFSGGADGELPFGDTLAFDSQGNIFGTTSYGGGLGQCQYAAVSKRCGVVYELSPPTTGTTWTETVLYSFTGTNDGGVPFAGVVLDSAGNIYGTTYLGGDTSCNLGYGCGTAFELSPVAGGGWSYSVLHTFSGGSDGQNPIGRLIFDALGNLYGETEWGGTECDDVNNCGTVFELSPSSGGWGETILYTFKGHPTDGAAPGAGLVFDSLGNLYGTTEIEGTNYYGTAFEITP